MSDKFTARQRRSRKLRSKTKEMSNHRLSIFRSNNHIYAQLNDDKNGTTIVSSSSIEKSLREKDLSRKDMTLILQ